MAQGSGEVGKADSAATRQDPSRNQRRDPVTNRTNARRDERHDRRDSVALESETSACGCQDSVTEATVSAVKRLTQRIAGVRCCRGCRTIGCRSRCWRLPPGVARAIVDKSEALRRRHERL